MPSSSFSESRMDADREGGTAALSSSSPLRLDSLYKGYKERGPLIPPKSSSESTQSPLTIYGVRTMLKPHPTADNPPYKHSPWKTRIDSGCCIRPKQHCLSLHLPLSFLPATTTFCHSGAVCLLDLNAFRSSYYKKVLEEKNLCLKSEGFTGQQTRPHAGAATGWGRAGSAKEGSAQTLLAGGSWLHKAAAVLVMGHRNTLASTAWSLREPEGVFARFCKTQWSHTSLLR